MKQVLIITYIFIVTVSYSQQSEISIVDYNHSIEFYNKGRLLLIDKSNTKEAIRLFQKAIALNPTNSDFQFILSKALLLQNELDSAIHYALEAIKLAPEQSDYHNHLAYLYFRKSDFKNAQNHFAKSIVFNENSDVKIDEALCYFNKGVCDLQLKQNQYAYNDLTKSISLNDSYAPAYHNLGIVLLRLDEVERACENFIDAQELGSNISSKYIDKYCSR